MSRKVVFVIVALCYSTLFYYQETFTEQAPAKLSHPLPSNVLKPVLGYLRQLGGEMLFIKTAAFLGGHFANYPDEAYAISLSRNFDVMANLHPHFVDIYFLCESSLSQISPDSARAANRVLDIGISALPDRWELPFFKSFNYNHILGEPLKAAETLIKVSKIKGAPEWLEHLASIRAAQGGDILAGLIWLKAMHRNEDEPEVKERYAKEIGYFESAIEVQRAVEAFRAKLGVYPTHLNELIPQFVADLPDFEGAFEFEWKPPVLSLKRP